MPIIEKQIAPAFENFLFDWDYEKYLVLGGYGSGKSYHIALKIALKLLEEKRKALILREVYGTLEESCYSLFVEIFEDMGLFTTDVSRFNKDKNVILGLRAPLRFRFGNGSQIIFKGMDVPEKVKSINGVSIVWFEEASEIKYTAYKELLGRIRTPDVSMHFFLSCNPVSRHSWIYRQFFVRLLDDGSSKVLVDEDTLYKQRELIYKGVYYHHSIPDDNKWLPKAYIKRLDELKEYDYPLYVVARWGRFGATGTRVFPQLRVARTASAFKHRVSIIPKEDHYYGFDFGFEESYNAVISMAVDMKNRVLYIYDEIYLNKVTDDVFAQLPEMQRLRRKLSDLHNAGYNKMLVADNEDPKAIAYYRSMDFHIRGCRNKFAGSRLSNTRNVKRFRRIVVSPKCVNTIRELKDLTYKRAANGDIVYDQFNIDPHTLSAIWYALDTVNLADAKKRQYNTKIGVMEDAMVW